MAESRNRRRSLILLLAPPIMFGLMWLAWSTDVARELENVTVNWRFKFRADRDPPPDPRIALIGIGEVSLREIGRWQDWSRAIHGQFLETLAYRPPSVVAFDFFFSEPSVDAEEDRAFADGLSLHPGAITGMFLDTSPEARERARDRPFPPISLYATRPFPHVEGDVEKLLTGPTASTPIEVIAQSSWTGSVNFPPSRIDGMRRNIPMIVRVGADVYPSLVLQILMQLGEADREQVRIHLGKAITVPRRDGGSWRIPIDEAGELLVNYRDTERFEMVDYYPTYVQIARSLEGEPWPEEMPELTDQIVIIGQAAEGLSDFGPTPYHPLDPLFRVQATVLDSILREDYLKSVSKPITLLGWLLIAWLTLWALRNAPISVAIAVPVAITVAMILLAYLSFERYSIHIPLALPLIGFVVLHTTIIGERLLVEFSKNRYIRGVFGSYVSPEVVDNIIDSGETPELGGEKVDITILFSDIQGFSTFSEQLGPEELVELMVEYLSELTDILTDSGGCLDKYIGDAIDAMFGAPIPVEHHAHVAVHCTIEMQRKQAELREKWAREGRPDLVRNMRTRIGLNTGAAVVGNMGSRRRFNYTMMGDNVNLGARCESGAKSYGVYTMVTDATRNAAEATADDVVYRFLDQIVVKGRTLPVKVHEVVETKERVTDESLECLGLYEKGIEAYLAMEWDEAVRLFEQSSRLELFQPDRDPGVSTNPSRVMISRCGLMKADPPPPDWDGIFRMASK